MMEAVSEKINIEKYPEYKESEIDWLGEVPVEWEIQPGFTIFEERKEKNIGLKEKVVLSLSYGSVIIKPEEKLTGLVPESFETYQLVYPGDIIIRPTDLQNDKVSLRTGLAKDKGIITSAYINLKVKRPYSPKFYHYLLQTIDNNKVIYGLGSGLRQNLDFGDFKRFKFLGPPVEEQTAIANFLDRKTAQIDKAIAQKEKLIELLKERRQILIHKAVTRGLDEKVKMKDSGVEWIGEIPEQWEVKKIKYLAHVNPPISYSSTTEHASFVPMECVGEYGGLDVSRIKPVKEVEKGFTSFQDGDVLIAKITPCFENFKGAIASNLENGIGFGTTELHILRAKTDLNNEYLFFITQSPYFRNYGTGMMYGTGGQKRVGTDFLANLLMPLPPVGEQNKINAFIRTVIQFTTNAICLKEKEIEKLKEYKTTLINAAVTGKIKV